MSLEKFAFNKLKQKYPNIRKNGLNACLKEYCSYYNPHEKITDVQLIPDGTLLDLEKKELILFEIEDSSKLTQKN